VAAKAPLHARRGQILAVKIQRLGKVVLYCAMNSGQQTAETHSTDSFFYRQRLPLWLLVIAFGLIALAAMMGGGGYGLAPAAWMFPAGLLLLFSPQIGLHGALLPGYAVYLGLLIALGRVRTATRAQIVLTLHLIVVILTVAGCHEVLKGMT
jgi:hypothetical protein